MPGDARQVDIVGIGLNATDTIIELPHFPAFNSKVEILAARILPGGQVATAMVACQQWGLRTRYVGKIGDDAAGELQSRELSCAGVEAHLLMVPNCLSQLAYILVDRPTGERTILWRRDPRLGIEPSELRKEWITSARLLHLDGHDPLAGVTAARWAREAGIPVLADLDNLYPGIEELMPWVDYPVTSQDFPSRLTGESNLFAALRRIHRQYACRVACATLGRDGALAWDGSRFWYSPSFMVGVADSTGAGDVFHAAFAYGLLQGWDLGRLLDFSCAAAALNCAALGARGGIRPTEEIEKVCNEGSRNPRAYSDEELQRAALES